MRTTQMTEERVNLERKRLPLLELHRKEVTQLNFSHLRNDLTVEGGPIWHIRRRAPLRRNPITGENVEEPGWRGRRKVFPRPELRSHLSSNLVPTVPYQVFAITF